MTIKFMDLSRQCKTLKDEMLRAIEDVYDETGFVMSHYVNDFENNFSAYIGSKHTSAVSNGTDALFLACKALDVKPGDEVIVPANTFIASAWAPLHCGAKVVFADCDKKDWLIDIDDVEKKINERTKAVIGVHLYGQPFDAPRLSDLCKDKNIHLIEDCAQAHGADWNGKTVGTFGDLGCFSFYPGKNLGAYGDAGAVVTDNEEYLDKVNMLKDHGSRTKYHHECPGYNMRMDGFQAAVLNVKLKYIKKWTERRKEIAKMYYDNIANDKVILEEPKPMSNGVHHLFPILADNREKYMDYLKNNDILCGIHYPIPCHLQEAFNNLGYNRGDLINSEYVADHCVSMPMYPELTDEEIEKVIEVVNAYE